MDCWDVLNRTEGRKMTVAESMHRNIQCDDFMMRCLELIADIETGEVEGTQELYDRIWDLSNKANRPNSYMAPYLNKIMEDRKKTAKNPDTIRTDYNWDTIRQWFCDHRSTGNKKYFGIE